MATLILAGCVSDEANRYYSNIKYPAKNVSDVQILKSRPEKAFIVIADFQSRGDTAKSLRKKAADIGADAIIVTYLGGYASTASDWAGDDPYASTYTRIIGTAIRYQ